MSERTAIFIHDGSNQDQRWLDALKPEFFQVDERSQYDLLTYLSQLARRIPFPADAGEQPAISNWGQLFAELLDSDGQLPSEADLARRLDRLQHAAQTPPALALLLAFLRLFRHNQQHLNSLTEAHLEYYYRQFLKLSPRSAEPDQVHVIFQPAKGVHLHRVPRGTLLRAGQDEQGDDILYATDTELVVNPARVASLRTIRRANLPDQKLAAPPAAVRRWLHLAPIADSKDGRGEAFADEPIWPAFGPSPALWDDAPPRPFDMGFAIASPDLLLAEGSRFVQVDFTIRLPDQPDAGARRPGDRTALERLAGGSSPADSGAPGDRIYSIERTAVRLTGGKGWVGKSAPLEWTPSTEDPTAGRLRVVVDLDPSAPPIVARSEDLHPAETALPSGLPLLQVDASRLSQEAFQALAQVEIDRIDLVADVDGVTQLELANDGGPLSGGQAFLPFGPQPKLGASFRVDCAAIRGRRLATLRLLMSWTDLPSTSFTKHYAQYGEISGNFQFQVQATLPDRELTTALFGELPSLEVPVGVVPPPPTAAAAPDSSASAKTPAKTPVLFDPSTDGHQRELFFRGIDDSSPAAARRALVALTLTGPRTPFLAFGHQEYPGIFTEASLKRAEEIARLAAAPPDSAAAASAPRPVETKDTTSEGSTPETDESSSTEGSGIEFPQPPYTPALSSIQLSYRTEPRELYAHGGRFLHCEPWGTRELRPDPQPADTAPADTAPRDTERPNAASGGRQPASPHAAAGLLSRLDDEGQLLIGITGLDPAQTVPILFQAVEGSAAVPSDEELPIRWSYLSDDRFLPFPEVHDVHDTTRNLRQPGIITFAIPASATPSQTRLPGQLHWLRASVPREADSVCLLRGVHAQAAPATLQMGAAPPSHLADGLPPNQVEGLADDDDAIQSVAQPYASQGGRGPEQTAPFRVRISERLRHKNRAVTLWDYEHLVLDAFPEIYKVKCIRHDPQLQASDSPGKLLVVIVPSQREQDGVNLKPTASERLRQRVRELLVARASPFAQIEVRNPVYEELAVEAQVQFRAGLSFDFYRQQLNQDIQQFLCPWAFEDGQDIVFAGRIHRSLLQAYIEGRSYVDYLASFGFSSSAMKNKQAPQDAAIVTATRADAILVSAPTHHLAAAR